MKKIKNAIHIINLPKTMASHLVGQNHSNAHRRCFGVAIMFIGVGFVKLTGMVDFYLVHFVGDIMGYAIHGIGVIPFLTSIENLND